MGPIYPNVKHRNSTRELTRETVIIVSQYPNGKIYSFIFGAIGHNINFGEDLGAWHVKELKKQSTQRDNVCNETGGAKHVPSWQIAEFMTLYGDLILEYETTGSPNAELNLKASILASVEEEVRGYWKRRGYTNFKNIKLTFEY